MSATLQLITPFASAVTILAIVGGVLTIITALALLRRGIFRLAEGMTTFNKAVAPNAKYMPLLAQLEPMMAVLQAVAKQVERNHGSSMRDEIDALAKHAVENKIAAAAAAEAAVEAKAAVVEAKAALTEFARANAAGIKALEVMMGTAKEHAADERSLARADRDLARDALQQMRELAASATRTEESGVRIEAADAVVAGDLAKTRERADDVASHEPPGTAADAASQTPEDADGE